MERKNKRVVRQGRVYHVMIAGTDYSMFIWQMGKQFRGRVEEHPHIPQQIANTALGVRDALQRLLIAAQTPS